VRFCLKNTIKSKRLKLYNVILSTLKKKEERRGEGRDRKGEGRTGQE
jgi:hypothetical protein